MNAEPVRMSVRGVAAASPSIASERILTSDVTAMFTGRGLLPAVVVCAPGPDGWGRVGSSRDLLFSDGGMVQETLLEYREGERYTYRAVGFTNALRFLTTEMHSELRFTVGASGGTIVERMAEFAPRPYRRSILRFVFAPLWKRYMEDIIRREIAYIEQAAEAG